MGTPKRRGEINAHYHKVSDRPTRRERRRRIQRRRRTFKLRNGFSLELGWHHGLNMFYAEFHHPSYGWGIKRHTSLRQLFGLCRYRMETLKSPEIEEVKRRFGLSNGVYSENAKVFSRCTEELSCNLTKGKET